MKRQMKIKMNKVIQDLRDQDDKKIICYQLKCKKNKNYYCTETDRTKCKLLQ